MTTVFLLLAGGFAIGWVSCSLFAGGKPRRRIREVGQWNLQR